MTDDGWVFDAYEKARHRLPQTTFSNSSYRVENLSEIADSFDTFLLDGFGVLRLGEKAIPGAVARVAELRSMGKRVMIVTNSAKAATRDQVNRYTKIGFDFHVDEIISSRDPLLSAIARGPVHMWGIIASSNFGQDGIAALNHISLADDKSEYDRVDAFLMLSCDRWTDAQQKMLEQSLHRNPRPVFVGNPDIAAPHNNGAFYQPGYYAHRLAEATSVAPQFFGKPFYNIFQHVFDKLGDEINFDRTVMVGDSLHTDILGGRVAGIKTALITNFGTLAGIDVAAAIKTSGIIPDYIMPSP